MVHLSNDILEEVLCRLPIKCLIRFRCVSKSWLALISSPYFVKLHFNRSVQTKRNLRLFKSNLFQVDFDSLHDDDVLQEVKFRNYGFVPKSSCDGLLCMSNTRDTQRVLVWNPSTRRNPSKRWPNTIAEKNYPTTCLGDDFLSMPNVHAIDNVFLWNPSTRKALKLPYASIEIEKQIGLFNAYVYCVYRIGYDNTNDDYKVVRIVILSEPRSFSEYEIMVYSLRSNSWHRLEKFPHCPNWSNFGDCIVGGALHFMSIVKSDLKSENSIVAFDLGTEKCRVLPQPEYNGTPSKLCLDNLGGCLSLSCVYESSIVDVFLLKEYGGMKEHWSRLITLSRTSTFKIFHPLKPIAYSKCGKKVWLNMDDKRLVLYNLEQKSVEEIKDRDRSSTSLLYKYCLESLVTVDVPGTTKIIFGNWIHKEKIFKYAYCCAIQAT
ncbi:F-box protein CPR1-like [Impatiens glandulifera]|uniref:F-box protein CPR1-like n=1 Tax=Impatiens glandulifera TaxID=253017 RepID=UPI001FB1577B|nr:F-box protein CPR1-like [Impatiens glandulifera]